MSDSDQKINDVTNTSNNDHGTKGNSDQNNDETRRNSDQSERTKRNSDLHEKPIPTAPKKKKKSLDNRATGSDTDLQSHGNSEVLGSNVLGAKSLGATDIESTFGNPSEISEIGSANSKPKNSQVSIQEFANDKIHHWKRQEVAGEKYGYFSLFRSCTHLDRIYLLVGVVAAVIGGICVPVLIYIFGNMVRAMVLVSRIQHSVKCHKEVMLGNETTCKNFRMKCSTDRPFKNTLQDFQTDQVLLNGLKTVTVAKMHDFAFWYCLMTLIFTICSCVYFISWHHAGDNQIGRIRKQYFEALLRKDMTWFDTQKDPDAVNRLMDQTRGIWIGMGENIPIAINLIVVFFVSLFVALAHGWAMTTVGLVAVFLLIFTTWLVSWTNAHKMMTELKTYKVANSIAEEVLKNIRTVIFYAGQKQELLRYKKHLDFGLSKVMRWIFAHTGSVFLLWMTNFLMWAVIFWYGISLVIYNHDCKEKSPEYDAGDVVIIILCLIFGAGNLYIVVPVFSAVRIAVVYGQKVFKVIDRKSLIDGMDTTEGIQISPDEFLGGIEFDDVRFTYPRKKDDVVLNHLSFKIAPSSTAGLVGLSGSGKTTVLKLLCKEYLPDSGFIKIDGVDIKYINTQWLRRQIGVVPQHPNFFDDSIEANIRMGKMDASFFEIQAACKSANAHSFIVSMKEAYQTKIGAHGFKLTAGQEQRLSIARALLRNPKILILDEPTINTITKHRTVIWVTHRLHTVTNSDQIYVMKRGKVAEKGTHANLVKSKGPYHQLASGEFDKPSVSVREVAPVQAFDVSEMTAVQCMRMFTAKPFLPNIYNDLLSIDPVALQFTKLQVKASNTLQDNVPEHDDAIYTLQNTDSITATDAALRKSECIFKDVPEPDNSVGAEESKRMTLHNSDEIEKLKEILNPNRLSFWKVFKFTSASTYKLPIIIIILSAVIVAFMLPIFGVLFGRAIQIMCDASAVPKDWEWAKNLGTGNNYKWLIIGFALLGIFGGIAAAAQEFLLSVASYNMINFIRTKLFAAFLKQDLAFFENPANSVSKMRDMLANDAIILRFFLNGFYATFVQSILAIVVSVVLAGVIYEHNLTGYAVVIAMWVWVTTFTDGWLAKKQQLRMVQYMSEISELILKVFAGKHQVTIMQLEPYFLDRFNATQMEALRHRRRLSYIRAFTFGLAQTSVFWGFTLFIYLAENEINNHGVQFYEVIATGQILLFGTMFLGTNLSTLPSYKIAVRAGEKILSVMNRKPSILPYTGEMIDTCTGHLKFHDVHFWYPFTGENPLLKGVTFDIEAGKTVAFVGSSESGKSAYLDIIGKFFNVSSGQLTLDGKNLLDLNVVSLRQQMGYIDKEPQLFHRTVAENIAYGDTRHWKSMSNIIEVAKTLKMHNFFCSLPDGYETLIGGPTDRLSTAQKQRIMIARAMLRKPKILLVDESIISLDREGERLVNESLEEARIGRTCIMIAHRLVAVQKADLIVVMNDGHASEIGTHAKLIQDPNNSEYGQLWRAQNPLQDSGFSSGKTWNGLQITKSKPKLKVKLPDPPPPLPTPSPPPTSPPPPPKVEEEPPKKEEEGWFGNWCAPSLDK